MAPWMNKKVVVPLTLADNRNCAANQPVSPFVKFFKEDPKDRVPPVHGNGSDGDSSDDDDDHDDDNGDNPDSTFNPPWNSTFDENNPDLNLSDSTVAGNSSNETGASERMDDSEVQFRDESDTVTCNFGAQRTRQQSQNAPYVPPRGFQFGSTGSQEEDVEMAESNKGQKSKSKSNFVIEYQLGKLNF